MIPDGSRGRGGFFGRGSREAKREGLKQANLHAAPKECLQVLARWCLSSLSRYGIDEAGLVVLPRDTGSTHVSAGGTSRAPRYRANSTDRGTQGTGDRWAGGQVGRWHGQGARFWEQVPGRAWALPGKATNELVLSHPKCSLSPGGAHLGPRGATGREG